MEKNNKFEKRKKGVVDVFRAIFWVGVIQVTYETIFRILYFTNLIKYDVTNWNSLAYIISFVYLGVVFLCVRLAKKGSVYAGVLGIIFGVVEILVAGTLWKFIGAVLLIDSIMYLVHYNKK